MTTSCYKSRLGQLDCILWGCVRSFKLRLLLLEKKRMDIWDSEQGLPHRQIDKTDLKLWPLGGISNMLNPELAPRIWEKRFLFQTLQTEKAVKWPPTMAYSWKRMEGVGDWNGTGVDETVLLTSGPEKQPWDHRSCYWKEGLEMRQRSEGRTIGKSSLFSTKEPAGQKLIEGLPWWSRG